MEIPVELFYLSMILFAALSAHTIYRGHREKEGFHYFVGILCLLGLGWSVMFILDQVPLAAAFWLVAMIVSVVMLPELTAFQDRRMGEVDVESPMRLADFFSNTYSGWLKLAYRRGLGVTVILFLLLFEVITGGRARAGRARGLMETRGSWISGISLQGGAECPLNSPTRRASCSRGFRSTLLQGRQHSPSNAKGG